MAVVGLGTIAVCPRRSQGRTLNARWDIVVVEKDLEWVVINVRAPVAGTRAVPIKHLAQHRASHNRVRQYVLDMHWVCRSEPSWAIADLDHVLRCRHMGNLRTPEPPVLQQHVKTSVTSAHTARLSMRVHYVGTRRLASSSW